MSYKKVVPAYYEGKASRLYEMEGSPNLLIIERKDDITAGNGAKHDVIPGKGAICNKISNLLFKNIDLYTESVVTHLVEEISEHETAIIKTTPIKLEVVVRNIATGSLLKRLPFKEATGSLLKRLPFKEGEKLIAPIVELYYKDDEAGDPLINASEAVALGVLEDGDYEAIRESALAVNNALFNIFELCDMTLVDMKLEFGVSFDNELTLIDEISPDTFRLWDKKTGRSMDKDIYRKGGSLEDVLTAYKEVLRRLEDRLNRGVIV